MAETLAMPPSELTTDELTALDRAHLIHPLNNATGHATIGTINTGIFNSLGDSGAGH